MQRFKNRAEAGLLLAERLTEQNVVKPVILALPRGGVPVAYEVSKRLNAPLDLILVKKIGAPGQPEYAVGAVSEDVKPLFNEGVILEFDLNRKELQRLAEEKRIEIKQQLKKFRGKKSAIDVASRSLIVVDDGAATGSTLLAALQFIKKKNPLRILVAVPVGPSEAIEKIRAEVDQVICLRQPRPFFSVGSWYDDFSEITDEEVRWDLRRADEAERGRLQTQSFSLTDLM